MLDFSKIRETTQKPEVTSTQRNFKMPRVLTETETASWLKLSVAALQELRAARLLPFYFAGKQIVFLREDVDAFRGRSPRL
jgi:hypothetical protein